MPASIMTAVSKGFGTIIEFVVIIAVSTLIALFLATSFGRGSARVRQAIFTLVFIIGIVVALAFMQYRLRHSG